MFPGFPPEGIKFLQSLARNNRREWFQPRKEIFETKLREPMISLIEEINAELLKIAPDYITDPKKAIYRIYRDTRFSKDKTPYKTHIAGIFHRHEFDRQAAAGFYFHISTKAIGIAAGSYMPGPDELRAVRSWFVDNHEAFRKAAKKPEKLLGKLQGSSVTRMPKGFDPDHPAADLIRMKQWFYWTEFDLKIATTPKLLGEILKRFRAAAPAVEMLNAPLIRGARSARATSLL